MTETECAAGPWISTGKELPEDYKVVLIREICTDGTPTWNLGYTKAGVWYTVPMSLKLRLTDDTVTHWAEVMI